MKVVSIVRALCLAADALDLDVLEVRVEKTCRRRGTCRAPSEVEQKRDEEASMGTVRVKDDGSRNDSTKPSRLQRRVVYQEATHLHTGRLALDSGGEKVGVAPHWTVDEARGGVEVVNDHAADNE
ncbi:hypothetical protein MMC15_007803 [Xylographa vitiligo]|nr:hypothetical protein [Xylographa vitiligo]